jgi:tetratricopeptide (TPR) repeat protein
MSRDKGKAQWGEIKRLYRRGMIASTARLAQHYVAENPKRGIAWLYYAASLAQMSRYSEAMSALGRAARFGPRALRPLVYFHSGQLFERRGTPRLADKYYRRAIATCPSDASYGIMLGRLLYRAGLLEEAKTVLRRASRCKEGHREEALLFLGYTLVGLQRFSEAKRCFRRALEIDPKYKEARQAFADTQYVINLGEGRKRRA